MKICYVVYREDDTLVFVSQVLEYLRKLKEHEIIDEVDLVLFKNENNPKTISEVKDYVLSYVDSCKIFKSMPVLSKIQLDLNAAKLKRFLNKKYGKEEQIGVICRGELATYVSVKSCRDMPNSRVLYDNRGLPYEESLYSHPHGIVYAVNRSVKKRIIDCVKNKCDCYNFVTNAMREYLISEYHFDKEKPYTIIPTLFCDTKIDENVLQEVKKAEGILDDEIIILYSGSTERWQSIESLVTIIETIMKSYSSSKCFILTNGTISQIERLDKSIRDRIIVKKVSHDYMRYYLSLSDVGIVIRDYNIVNRVAAPTKIAEYVTNGMQILCSGKIGILDDVSSLIDSKIYTNIDETNDWIFQLSKKTKSEGKNEVLSYFDMKKRQLDTINMLSISFNTKKLSI